MSSLHWVSDRDCHIRQTRVIRQPLGDPMPRTDADRLVMLKTKRFFDQYVELLGSRIPKNVLELGIFEGGSAVILAAMWPGARVISIDSCKPNSAVADHLQVLGLSDRVSLYYEISQDDSAAIHRILDTVLGAARLDLVVDDGAHLYYPSRQFFDIVFPYVAPGGWYLIEDWGWAHWRDWPEGQQLADEPALSNLVFELVMASASTPSAIAQLRVTEIIAAVQRGSGPLPTEGSLLDQLYTSRDRALVLL